jgi:hypothetical protein
MRDIVIFLLLIVAVFIGIGEWRGWYLGVPGTTPVVLYKMDHRAVTDVRTVTRSDMPIRMEGRVRQGTVTVEVTHERPTSFQTGEAALPERVLYEQTFGTGQRIAINDVFAAGRGIYRVRVTYADVSGTFRFTFPRPSEL